MTQANDDKSNRTERITVRFTKEEKQIIDDLADSVSVAPSAYLRAAGLNQRITSMVDLETMRQMRKASTDMARIGNLLKMLMTNKEKVKGHESNVQKLIADFEEAKNEIQVAYNQVLKELNS